jgi:undecaprenyl-diphosphatase
MSGEGTSDTKRWVAAAILLLLVEVVLIAWVDRPLSLCLRELDANHRAVVDIFRSYTSFAKAEWYLVPSGVVGLILWALGRRRLAKLCAYFFTSVAVAGLMTALLKCLFGRARPVQLDQFGIYEFRPWNWTEARWHSLPSGEATTAFAVAAALFVLFPRYQVLWWIFAVVMAAARVAVNAHYLSDIVAGAAVGTATAFAVKALFVWKGWPPLAEERGARRRRGRPQEVGR